MNNNYRVDHLNIKRRRYWLDFIFYSQYVLMIDNKKMGTLKPGQSLTLKVNHKERHTIWIEHVYIRRLRLKIMGPKSKKFDIKNTSSTNNITLEIQHSRVFILINTLIMLLSLPLLGLCFYFSFYFGTFLLLVVFIIYSEFTRKVVKNKNITIKEVSE